MKIKEALKLGSEQCYKSPTSMLDARILLCKALSLSHERLIIKYDDILSSEEVKHYFDLIKRRTLLEPVAYILGRQEFYGRDFIVNNTVLIPRPDTELLVHSVIEDYKANYSGQKIQILELGTGSGAIAVTLAKELEMASITAVDISNSALETAKINASAYSAKDKINFVLSDWFSSLPPLKFHYIVSNPPYIASTEQIYMSPSTHLFEPSLALYARGNGLAAYQAIIPSAIHFLDDKGKIFLEIGYTQRDKVVEILKDCGFKDIKIEKDIAGYDRVITCSVSKL